MKSVNNLRFPLDQGDEDSDDVGDEVPVWVLTVPLLSWGWGPWPGSVSASLSRPRRVLASAQ